MSKLKLRNLEMGDAYRQRVGKFIKKMIQEPILVNEDLTMKLNQSSACWMNTLDNSIDAGH